MGKYIMKYSFGIPSNILHFISVEFHKIQNKTSTKKNKYNLELEYSIIFHLLNGKYSTFCIKNQKSNDKLTNKTYKLLFCFYFFYFDQFKFIFFILK
jgi:hypothetical protein